MLIKRLAASILSFLLLLTLFACNNDKKPQESLSESESQSSETASLTPGDMTTETEDTKNTSDVTTDTQPPESRALTETELRSIEEYLNQMENNGFISNCYYTAPNEIDLCWVFYDGAGIMEDFTAWDSAEKQAVLTATGWETFFNTPIKISSAAANALLMEKCGLSLESFQGATIPNFYYLESYDAYYAMHGDINYTPVTVLSGEIDSTSGHYILSYTLENQDTTFTVILRKSGNGYQFISNTVTENNETTESEITQSMELNRYIRSLTKFFYEPCDKLNSKAFRDDILCLLFSFSYNYGEQLGFAAWDEARADESLLVIQGEGLRKVGKILLGDDFNAWDYNDTLDWGEYIEENDTYEVSFGTDYWGGSDCYLTSGTVPEIIEKEDEVIVAVSIQFSSLNYADENDPNGNNGQAPYQLQYRFKKVINDGFLFYQLVSITNI